MKQTVQGSKSTEEIYIFLGSVKGNLTNMGKHRDFWLILVAKRT